MSSWDVIRHEFEDRHIQAYMLWQAFQTVQAVDALGSGSLAYSLIYSRQQRSWSVPLGGSGKLTDGLTAFLEEHGARIICDRKVAKLVLENGRCAGVETEDGERYLGTKAVVSTIHVKHLIDMAPHDAWPEDFHYGVETYDIGITNMGVYIAAKEAPEVHDPRGHADRGVGRAGRLAGGHGSDRPGREGRQVHLRRHLAPGRDPDPGRSVARARTATTRSSC